MFGVNQQFAYVFDQDDDGASQRQFTKWQVDVGCHQQREIAEHGEDSVDEQFSTDGGYVLIIILSEFRDLEEYECVLALEDG